MRTVHLKVKIKSLAAEARIIRLEEHRALRRARNAQEHEKRLTHAHTLDSLRSHRLHDVRSETRCSLLAYGFLRGRQYRQIEPKCHAPPDWDRVESMVKRFSDGRNDLGSLKEWAG